MSEAENLEILKEAISYGQEYISKIDGLLLSEEENSHNTVIINGKMYDLHDEAKIKYDELIKEYEKTI